MAEGGEPPIHKVCPKVAIGSSHRKGNVQCVSVRIRHGERDEHVEDMNASGSSGGPKEKENVVSSIRVPRNMQMGLARMTPEEIGNRKCVTQLSNSAERLISKSDYKAAATVLEAPCILESDFFMPKLMLAECYLFLGKDIKWENIIEEINKSLVVSLGRNPDDLLKYAEDYLHNSMYVRAIIVVRKSSDMYKTSASTRDEALNGIKLCSEKAHFATQGMISAGGISRLLGVEYGIKFMKEILRDLRSVENAGLEDKASASAWSCNFIAANLQLVEKYERSIKYLKRGVEFLDKQFGPKKLNYRVYGSLMLYLGTAYDNLGDYYWKGENYYTESFQAKRIATDYKNESEKRDDIELPRSIMVRRRKYHASYLGKKDATVDPNEIGKREDVE